MPGARGGSVTVSAFELKDGKAIADAGQQTFTMRLTTKVGVFTAIRTPDGNVRTSDPRLKLTFVAPSTFRLDIDNALFGADAEVDIIVEANLSERVAAQAVPGVIGTADSILALAFPEFTPTVCVTPCLPRRHCRFVRR
jgi:hypothetical protein